MVILGIKMSKAKMLSSIGRKKFRYICECANNSRGGVTSLYQRSKCHTQYSFIGLSRKKNEINKLYINIR